MDVENLDNFKYPFWGAKNGPFFDLAGVVLPSSRCDGGASSRCLKKDRRQRRLCASAERFHQHAWTRLRTNGHAETRKKKDLTSDPVLGSKFRTPKRGPRIHSFL